MPLSHNRKLTIQKINIVDHKQQDYQSRKMYSSGAEIKPIMAACWIQTRGNGTCKKKKQVAILLPYFSFANWLWQQTHARLNTADM